MSKTTYRKIERQNDLHAYEVEKMRAETRKMQKETDAMMRQMARIMQSFPLADGATSNAKKEGELKDLSVTCEDTQDMLEHIARMAENVSMRLEAEGTPQRPQALRKVPSSILKSGTANPEGSTDLKHKRSVKFKLPRVVYETIKGRSVRNDDPGEDALDSCDLNEKAIAPRLDDRRWRIVAFPESREHEYASPLCSAPYVAERGTLPFATALLAHSVLLIISMTQGKPTELKLQDGASKAHESHRTSCRCCAMSTVNVMNASQYATAADHLMAAKMFSLASCVMIFYDITITFSDEVEKIWKRRFTGATFLWFVNRYLLPLGYIVVIVSFHDRSWSTTVCDHYILYPEVLKIFSSTAIGAIFILRLYAIYARNRVILVAFTSLLIAEIALKIWAFTDGTRLVLPPGLVGCILTGKSQLRYVWTWIAELIFDSCVFIATLYKCVELYRNVAGGTASGLIHIMMRDGIMYFGMIFASNVLTVIIFMVATPDLKAINASFTTLITSLMVSRLMLNLRSGVQQSQLSTTRRDDGLTSLPYHNAVKYDFIDTVIGNLGEEVSYGEAEAEADHDDSGDYAGIEMERIDGGEKHTSGEESGS
ncbi:hypothetical protein NM688_g8126 [Phlebia brevispora]|uniref:Uncharacterized protein n=1 Tax=Phlebia brevispora TaxID=194682 RepID=A0ACC1RX50_9APHY|nr:hypothetical protein NM688_g8126 [Phlebia brevispora]